MQIVQNSKTSIQERPTSTARRFWRRFRRSAPADPSVLFGGDDELFKQLIATAEVYGEYGMGKSTRYAVLQSACKVLAVETSRAYIDSVSDDLDEDDRLDARYVDVGPVGKWGRPLSYEKRRNFLAYAASIWQRDKSPDLVLVDGRFRVSCLLYSLLHGATDTRILFDDYVPRPHYHVVEELIRPAEFCGRQALFVIPETFDRRRAQAMLDEFRIVWD